MSDIVKKKVIDIEVGQSVKNIDNLTKSFVPLKRQIKDLRDQMGQLTKGTKEYDEAALKLAELQQKQREIAEAAKYSNQDFGAVMSNLTKVSMGFAGGINAISASMALLGGDSEKMQKALAPIQLVMAAIQGFSAIDTAIKSLKGLNNMLGTLGSTSEKAADSVTALGTDIDSIGDKDISLNVDTKKAEKSVSNLDKKIKSSTKDKKVKIDADTKKADKNIKTLETEIKSVGDKKVDIDADTTEATTKVEELKTEIETIPDKNINIDTDTTSVIESVEDVTESLEDMADIDIEVKAEGIDTVTKEVKNLNEAEKTLATNTQTATTATNNLNTATKSTATSTSAMAVGAKTAAVASTTLAAGEGVATKASWTLTGALKAVGTAIKSIPVIGWIMMAVSALTALIKLIVKANKESDMGAQIAKDILQSEKDRLEVLGDIELKYRKIRKELMNNIGKLQLLPKTSREYKEALDDVASALGLSKEFIEANVDSLNTAVQAATNLNEYTEKISSNEKAYNQAIKDERNLREDINEAIREEWNTSNRILQNMVDEGRITEDQMKSIQKVRKERVKGDLDQYEAQQRAYYVVSEQLDAYLDIEAATASENSQLQRKVQNENRILKAVQTESDAYDELLEKQKESKKAAEEYYKKYLDAQKSYRELMEEMAISDAEYNGDWNRYADERKKKAERIYNDDLNDYKNQLKEKLITQEQYDNIVKARQEQYSNDTAQIQLETNKKMWEQQLKDSLEAIEKEKNERIKAASEQYVSDVKSGSPTASETKNIASDEAELEAMKRTNEVLKQRLQTIQQNKDESAEYAEYVKELQDQIAENERKVQEMELQIDMDGYEKRKKEAETYYNSIDQLAADRINQSIIDNNGEGNNLFIEQQQIELQAIRDKMEAVKQAYEEGLITEAEYHSRSLELQAEYVARSKEYDEQHQQSILSTANTYAQTVQMIGSSISGVLQEVMANYDENSEEYKKMAVANAIIQTISGQLGAFFSGVNSGVPAPWNFLLGGVLATAALTTGLIGIANIKSGKLGGVSGNISSSASNLGRGEYETTAYAQQTEMLGTVTDQRVTVLEADISTAQNNVNVMESDNTF